MAQEESIETPPLFEWMGEEITVKLPVSMIEELENVKRENPSKFWEFMALLLSAQRPEMFSVRPKNDRSLTLADYQRAKKEFGPSYSGMETPEQYLWARQYPKAQEFARSMARYGLVQGATLNLADQWGLQGSDVPYRMFQHLYPTTALTVEMGGSLALGGGVGAGRSLLVKYAPSLFGWLAPARGAKTGLERGLQFSKETLLGGVAGATGMGAYRYGALPAETEDKFSKALTSMDVGIGAGVGLVAPSLMRIILGFPNAIVGFKNLFRDKLKGAKGREDLIAVEDVGRAIAQGIPALEAMGITRQEVYDGLMAAARHPDLIPSEVMLLTNLAKRMKAEGKPYKASRIEALDRELAWALKHDPDFAGLTMDDLATRALGETTRIMDDLFDVAGQPGTFAASNLLESQRALKRIWRPAYDAAMGERLVIGRGLRATGHESATLKGQYDSIWNELRSKDNTVLRRAWNLARENIKTIRGSEGARAEFLKKHGRIPDELPTVQELLKNRYIRKQRDAQKLLALRGSNGKPLYKKLKTKYDPDNPGKPDWILKKMDNTIDVQQAQLVERALYTIKETKKYASSPDSTVALQGIINNWNGVMSSQSPAYNIARLAYHESELLESAYNSGRKFDLSSSREAGESFLGFVQDQLDMYEREFIQNNPDVMEKVRKMYVSSALQNVTDSVRAKGPEAILGNPEAMKRIEYLIARADVGPSVNRAALDKVKENLQLEDVKRTTIARMPSSPGMVPSAAERVGATTLEEQIVPSAAMASFAPMFFAGRKSTEFLRWLRMLSNSRIGRQKLQGMMGLDPSANEKFVEKLIPEVERALRWNPNRYYPATRAVRGASRPVTMEGGEDFKMPERRKELMQGLIQ